MAGACSTSGRPSEIVEMHILWRVWPLYGVFSGSAGLRPAHDSDAGGRPALATYAPKIPIIGSCRPKLLASTDGPPSS